MGFSLGSALAKLDTGAQNFIAGSTGTNFYEQGAFVIGKLDPNVQTAEGINFAAGALGLNQPYSEGAISSYVDVANTVGALVALYYGGAYAYDALGAGGVAAVASAGAQVYGNIQQQKELEKQQQAAAEAQKKKEAKEQAQYLASKRKQLREQRIIQARALNAAQAQGVLGSSGAIGFASASTTLFGGALAFQSGQTVFNKAISADLQKATDAENKAREWATINNSIATIASAF